MAPTALLANGSYDRVASMHLDVRGHPLHSRALSVTLLQRADGMLDVRGRILDLRKRGFVPVAGDLQTAGVVHDMQLDTVIDPTARRFERLVPEQRAVAFEPSAVTEGESCRDPIDRITALAGSPIDAELPRRLSATIGGPRGCSHLLTLSQLIGSTVTTALNEDAARFGSTPARRAGERLFRRDLIVDGHEAADGHLELAIQLTDLHYAPAPALALPMDRFAGQLEVRGLASVDLPTWSLKHLAVSERRRTYADLESATWRDRAEAVQSLFGISLFQGVSGTVMRAIGDDPGDRPLLDALLMLAPALIQCAAALSEMWPTRAKQSRSMMATGGMPDSCYMWRREGALHKSRGQDE